MNMRCPGPDCYRSLRILFFDLMNQRMLLNKSSVEQEVRIVWSYHLIDQKADTKRICLEH